MRWLRAPGFALSLALVLGGCSFSYQLDSMFSRERGPSGDTTASAHQLSPRPQSSTGMFSLAAIYAAVSEALGRGGSSTSVPWEDPATGARGTVTPLSSAYVQDGTTCRDFLASYVRGSSESWLQGEACRSAQDRWEVRNMRPWRRT
jgi:17 kDa outer membrane surface antigen